MQITIELVILGLVIFGVLFWQYSTLISLYSGIQYVYSKDSTIKLACSMAKLAKNENYYELGSGLGRGLKIATNNFGANSTGFEISPFHYLVSKFLTMKNHQIKITRSNFLQFDLSKADVIYCYLCNKLMNSLSIQFFKQLKPGTRIVSYCFELPNIVPKKTEIINGKKLRLYII
jgi:hypothetical protein